MRESAQIFKDTGSVLMSKGVVDEPIIEFAPKEVMLAFVHLFMGIFNKLYSFLCDQLLLLFDTPYLQQTGVVKKMEDKIQILDMEQKDLATKIKEHDKELVTLKIEKHHLAEYVRTL